MRKPNAVKRVSTPRIRRRKSACCRKNNNGRTCSSRSNACSRICIGLPRCSEIQCKCFRLLSSKKALTCRWTMGVWALAIIHRVLISTRALLKSTTLTTSRRRIQNMINKTCPTRQPWRIQTYNTSAKTLSLAARVESSSLGVNSPEGKSKFSNKVLHQKLRIQS